jgi:hypothetical protein
MAHTDAVPGTAEPHAPPDLPDYRGQPLDIAFADVVRQHRGPPVLVDGEGNRVRVQTLGDWMVVHQGGIAQSVVLEIERIC